MRPPYLPLFGRVTHLCAFNTCRCDARPNHGRLMALRPIVVSGPSGGGKSTILKRLFNEYKNCFAFSVSHTTRKPRPGEKNGVDYHFVTKEEMQRDIAASKFLEHAEFSGNLYGTSLKSVEDVLRTGQICVLDIDLAGVKSVRASSLDKVEPQPHYILVKPPSLEELEKRLVGRGTEDQSSLQKRLDRARTDMKEIDEHPDLFNHVVVNDNLDTAYAQFVEIIKDDLAQIQKK